MEIRKAIITAAGQSQRTLPLQSLVDRDGVGKTALAIIIEEILQAGLEEICVVIWPGDQAAYTTAAGSHASRLRFVEQTAPLGYGHAVHCARGFAENQPFLLLVGDHLYVSGSQIPGKQRLYEVQAVLEKPTPTEAEQKLIVPGLRAGHYLCFFGMHVLTPAVLDLLSEDIAWQSSGLPSSPRQAKTGIHLTTALSKLANRERYLASELEGRRYDIGVKYGLLTAQLALALDGHHRAEVLSQLVELLATSAR